MTVNYGFFGFASGALLFTVTFVYSMLLIRLLCEAGLSLFMIREHFSLAELAQQRGVSVDALVEESNTDTSPLVYDDEQWEGDSDEEFDGGKGSGDGSTSFADSDDPLGGDAEEGGGHPVEKQGGSGGGSGLLASLTGGGAAGGYQAL